MLGAAAAPVAATAAAEFTPEVPHSSCERTQRRLIKGLLSRSSGGSLYQLEPGPSLSLMPTWQPVGPAPLNGQPCLTSMRMCLVPQQLDVQGK